MRKAIHPSPVCSDRLHGDNRTY